MIGVHNYYLDFLKSFKKLVSDSYPDINNYQFNYSSSTYLNYQLYKKHTHEFPLCHINLMNIQVEDVESIKRLNTNTFNTTFHLCNNDTKQESVYIDFKFVTLQLNVKINIGSTVDIFNYLNIAQDRFPLNFMFYDYKYTSFINLSGIADNWEVDDETENVYYRSVQGHSEMYATYETEPVIKINSLTSSKQVELKSQDGNFVELDMEVRLKVPRMLMKNELGNNELRGIEIVINTNSYSETMPILIDMNNNTYSDLQDKALKVFIIPKDKLELHATDGNFIYIDSEYRVNLEDTKLAAYLVDDSCQADPTVLFIELGNFEDILTNEIVIDNETYLQIDINKTKLDKQQLDDFNIGELGIVELITFNK